MVSRSWPNTEWAYLVAKGLPVGPWVTTIPRSNRPEHTRTNAMRSRWLGSMLACTLKAKAENGASSGRGTPDVSSRGCGDGARSTTASSSRRTPKLVSADPKNTGDTSPLRKRSSSMPVGVVEQLELVGGRAPRVALRGGRLLAGQHLLAGLGGAAAVRVKRT